MVRAETIEPAVWLQAQDVRDLLQAPESPCVSIYVPMEPPTSRVNVSAVRFRNQLREAERRLGLRHDPGQRRDALLEPLRRLAEQAALWDEPRGAGLVVFRSPDRLRVREVLQPVPELTVVADTFHVRPLVRLVQDAARHQVLCVSNERVALYEGGMQRLAETPLHPDVPRNMADAIGEPSNVTKTRRTIYDQGETDPRDAQLLRYFRRLDEAVWQHHSERTRLPLILAALPEYHGFFRKASHNTYLLDQGIRRDPFKEIDERELARLAAEARQPSFDRRVSELHDQFAHARAHDKASDDLEAIAPLAMFGRLATLLVEQGRRVGGVIDHGTGAITYKPMSDPAVDDLIDDLAETVLSQGGEVLVLPAERMPTGTGVAGIQRF